MMTSEAFLTEFLHHALLQGVAQGFATWLEAFEDAREKRVFERCQILLRSIKGYHLPAWEQGKVCQCQGLLLLDLSQTVEAARFLQQSLEIFRQIGNQKSEAQVLGNLGVLYKREGQWNEAIRCYRQQLDVYKELKLFRSCAETLTNLGSAYEKKGLLDEAERSHRLSLELFGRVGTDHDRGRVLTNLGVVYLSRAQRQEALDCYQQAHELFSQSGDHYQESLALNNIGTVYRQMGRWQEAVDSYLASLAMKQELQDVRGVGTTLNNLGMVHRSAGDLDQAETFFQRSLNIADEVGDKYNQAMALCNLCRTSHEAGNTDVFGQRVTQALRIAEPMGYTDITSEIERLLGDAALKSGHYEAGFQHLDRAAELAVEYGPEFLEMILAHAELTLITLTDDDARWTIALFEPLVTFWEKWKLNEELGDFFRRVLKELRRQDSETTLAHVESAKDPEVGRQERFAVELKI